LNKFANSPTTNLLLLDKLPSMDLVWLPKLEVLPLLLYNKVLSKESALPLTTK